MMDDGDDLSDHSEDERLLRADVDDMSDGDDDGVPPAKRARVDAVAATWMRRAAPRRRRRPSRRPRRRNRSPPPRRRGVRRQRRPLPTIRRRRRGSSDGRTARQGLAAGAGARGPRRARPAAAAAAEARRALRRGAAVRKGLGARSGAARQPAPVPYFGVGRTHRSAAPAPGRVVETLRGVAGKAIFAPLDPRKRARGLVLGHVVDAATGRQFQVVGTEEPCPAGCLCAKVDLFSLTFTDPRLRRRATALVEATGGDYLRLAPADAAGCAFEAESLIAERAHRSWPALPLLADATARGTEVLLNVGTVACAQLLFSEIPS
ncbi:hypothetical protein JL722_14305 [Aureococcus anophagefferens]|nr:hypothetical protein JL722_14305 [Aureococcus anophagefferens]